MSLWGFDRGEDNLGRFVHITVQFVLKLLNDWVPSYYIIKQFVPFISNCVWCTIFSDILQIFLLEKICQLHPPLCAKWNCWPPGKKDCPWNYWLPVAVWTVKIWAFMIWTVITQTLIRTLTLNLTLTLTLTKSVALTPFWLSRFRRGISLSRFWLSRYHLDTVIISYCVSGGM